MHRAWFLVLQLRLICFIKDSIITFIILYIWVYTGIDEFVDNRYDVRQFPVVITAADHVQIRLAEFTPQVNVLLLR